MREENKNYMKKLQPLFNVFNFLLFLFLELSCFQNISWSSINLLIGFIILSVESFVFLKQPHKYTIAVIILINIFLFMLYTAYMPASLLFLKLERKTPIILLIITTVFTLIKTVFEIISLKRNDNVFKTKER